MPIRAPRTWMGVTPIEAMPRSAPGRMEPDSPILPAVAGHSQPAVAPGRASSAASRRRIGPVGRPAGRSAVRLAFRLPAGMILGGATPEGLGGGGAQANPAPRPNRAPVPLGSLPSTARAARAARAPRANGAARPRGVAVPADQREGRCASPEGRSAHRTPMSFARSGTALSRPPLIGWRGPARQLDRPLVPAAPSSLATLPAWRRRTLPRAQQLGGDRVNRRRSKL